MSQQIILEFLNDNIGKKYTTKQLSEILDINKGSIVKSCTALIKYRFIKHEYHTIKNGIGGFNTRRRVWVGGAESDKVRGMRM